MKASDLHLFELLELDPELGSIQFKNRRMLLWDADAFGHLRNELIVSLGEDRARPLLRRFGFANGYRDALTTGETFNWDDDAQWWLACPALQRNEGKVRAEPTKLSVNRETGEFHMEVTWHNSYEASQHRRMFGKPEHPVCWTLAGFASGFSSAVMGEEVFVVETHCAAMGGERCQVIGKTRRAWGAVGEEIASEYEAQPLTVELEKRERELRRQRAALRRREREIAHLRGNEPPENRFGIACKSRAMRNVLDLAQTVARVDSTVLITGESGVGKERVARVIHDESPRSDKEMLAINCGALPETLLDSELFGHVRGAFTGADSDKQGLFEAARGGTVFLDEIGETSPATQVKLLRVLQEREVLPVGATSPRRIDVRVLAATNRNLEAMIEAGKFRADLFYRLNVVAVEIPPLRRREGDVLALARDFIAATCAAHGVAPKSLSPEAAESLTAYRWPGNVRELQNAIERAVVLSDDAVKIVRAALPPEIRDGAAPTRISFDQVIPMADLERRYVLEVLHRFDGNRTHTAQALGIGANTLWRKLKRWGIPPARQNEPGGSDGPAGSEGSGRGRDHRATPSTIS